MSNLISPLYEAFYIESLLFDADIAVGILQELDCVELPSGLMKSVAEREFLTYLQVFVQHSAALSRYFWPVRRPHERRGEQLRQALLVTNSSPLRNRDLRNALEHFDERLDIFLDCDPIGHFLPEFVGPMPGPEIKATHFFRAYFPEERVFELLGTRYQIAPLVEEVTRIHELLLKMRKSGRF